MNDQPVHERALWPSAVAVLGAFLIVAALIWAMRRYTSPPPADDRPAVRAKALAELRAAEAEALHTVGWIDKGKGLVRLRIEDAMNLVEERWRDPQVGRSNLVAREEKASAVPPKAPEKPSPFE